MTVNLQTMACKSQASVHKGPLSPKTCPGTRGVLYGGEKIESDPKEDWKLDD